MAGPFPSIKLNNLEPISPSPIRRPLLERRRRWTEPTAVPSATPTTTSNLSIMTSINGFSASPTQHEDLSIITSKDLEELTLIFKRDRVKYRHNEASGNGVRPRRRHTTKGPKRSESLFSDFGSDWREVGELKEKEVKTKSLDSSSVGIQLPLKSEVSSENHQDSGASTSKSKPIFSLSLEDEDGNEIDSDEEGSTSCVPTPRASLFNSSNLDSNSIYGYDSVTPRASTFMLENNFKGKRQVSNRELNHLKVGEKKESDGDQPRYEGLKINTQNLSNFENRSPCFKNESNNGRPLFQYQGSLIGGKDQLRSCGRFNFDDNLEEISMESVEMLEDEFSDFDSVIQPEDQDDDLREEKAGLSNEAGIQLHLPNQEEHQLSNWKPISYEQTRSDESSTSTSPTSTSNWTSSSYSSNHQTSASTSPISTTDSIPSFQSCFEEDDSDSDEEEQREEEADDEDSEWETLVPRKGSFLSTQSDEMDEGKKFTKSLDSGTFRPKLYKNSQFSSTSSLNSIINGERARARPPQELKLGLPAMKYEGR